MNKRTIIGLILAFIGIGIVIYGFTVTSELADNRVFRIGGYALTMIGIYMVPEKRKQSKITNK